IDQSQLAKAQAEIAILDANFALDAPRPRPGESLLQLNNDDDYGLDDLVNPFDFAILDIKEDKKKPFILETPFLTTTKAEIRFDKGTITLKSGKKKINFFKIPRSLCRVEEGTESDIDPVAPTTTVSRLILEWEEKTKLYQDKEMEFSQWRSKVFNDERSTLVNEGCEVSDEGGVTYCPPSKTAKQLEEICNFKQEGDETLYQAWEWYNDLLYKCPTHNINSHQKVNIFYNGLGTMNHQLLDSQGPIPGMTPAQALTTIQTMADHSQKWHDGSSSKNIESSSNSEGIAAIVNKLENLGRDMKKLKENVHAIQVGCQICEGAHLDKDFPLNEEVKSVEEVKYGEFSRPFPNNNRNDSRFNRYDQPSSGERRPSLIEIINKYIEDASKRHAKQDEWLKKTICTEDGSPLYTPFYYSPEEIEYFSSNSRFFDNEKQETNNSGREEALAALEATLKIKKEEPKEEKQSEIEYFSSNLRFSDNEKQEIDNSGMAKALAALEATLKIQKEEPKEEKQSDLVENKPKTEEDEEIRMNPRCSALLQNHLPPKEQDRGSFILPCSIGKLDFNNALADLGASINVMPLSMFGDEEDDLEEKLEDPKECGEGKANVIMGPIHDKLNNDWFNNTSEDEEDWKGYWII
ncbi:hypothetical protein Tco_0647406, partial [Tanacetum coccineum]